MAKRRSFQAAADYAVEQIMNTSIKLLKKNKDNVRPPKTAAVKKDYINEIVYPIILLQMKVLEQDQPRLV